jgi:hypothetical protein
MKLIFNQELDDQSVRNLIDEIDNADDFVDLYFTTPGGSAICYNALLEYLNSKKDQITLIANWEISSGGFLVFFKFKGEKRIIPGTSATIHLTTSEIDARDFLKERSRTIMIWKKLQDIWKLENEFYFKLGIKPDKRNLISTGHDVYLDYSELEELLERSKKNEDTNC